MSDLKAFVSDPRFQSRDAATKRAMLIDWGVAEADIAPLVAYVVQAPSTPVQVGVNAHGTANVAAPARTVDGSDLAKQAMGFVDTKGMAEEGTQVLNALKGMGRGALGLAQFAGQVGMNPVGAGMDAANASVANIEKAGAAAGQGEILQALANMGGAVPVAGPGMLDLGERTAQTGDVAGAIGELAAAPLIMKGLTGAVPPTLAKLRGMTLSPLEMIRMSAKIPGRAGKLGRIVVGGESLVSKLEKLGAPEQVEVIRGLPKPEFDLVMDQIEATKMNDRMDAKAQAARDAAAKEQARLDYARTKIEMARENAATNLANRDTFAAAKTEASLLEKSDAAKVRMVKQRENAGVQSAKAEVKILEDAQRAEAAAKAELASVEETVKKTDQAGDTRAYLQALKSQEAAAIKAEKAAQKARDAERAAEAAQISREFRQRKQLDAQAKREAAKAAKETLAPQIDLKAKFEVADPDVPARAEAKIQAGEARKARREADAAMNDPKAVKAMKPVDMKLVNVVLQQAAKDGMTRAQAADLVAEMGLGFSQGKPNKFAFQAVDRAIAAGLKFKP